MWIASNCRVQEKKSLKTLEGKCYIKIQMNFYFYSETFHSLPRNINNINLQYLSQMFLCFQIYLNGLK